MVQIIAILNKYQQARADIKHLILASTATQKGTCAMCIKSKRLKHTAHNNEMRQSLTLNINALKVHMV